MKQIFLNRTVLAVIAVIVVCLLVGCGEDEKRVVNPPAQLVGTVTGTITLPVAASGKTLWVILDKDDNKENVPEGASSCVCGSGTTYEYTFSNYPIGLYYIYAIVYNGSNDEGPPQEDDFFGYYGSGLTLPDFLNVLIGIDKTTTCDFELHEVP